MTILGITGGMGSGKSLVCEILKLHRIPIYDADSKAKQLNDNSPVIKEQLIALFGPELYTEDGRLDRRMLASYIFNNKEHLAKVNKIIHTQLALDFQEWTTAHQHHPIVAIDAAVLLEANFQQYVDKVITITAPEKIRIERVKQRDNLTEKEIKARMASQMSEEEKIKKSDFVIINDNKRSLIQQVDNILQDI